MNGAAKEQSAKFARKYRETDWTEYGRQYLEAGRWQRQRRETGYRIDPRPEPPPDDGPEPEHKQVCREGRNWLRLGQSDPADPEFQARVDHCREIQREKTRKASHDAALFLERVQRVRAEENESGLVCKCLVESFSAIPSPKLNYLETIVENGD